MSNHVRLLADTAAHTFRPAHIEAAAQYLLTNTISLLAERTARSCNRELGGDGALRHHESYDQVVRNQQEHERNIWHIANKSGKVGPVKTPEDWKFTFVK